MEEKQTYESWDIKKILIALILFVILVVLVKAFILDNKPVLSSRTIGVEGVTNKVVSTPAPALEIKKSVESKLNELNREVNNINVVEIATSTPAVQKILNDLKNLQSLPQSQAKQTCLQICNGL